MVGHQDGMVVGSLVSSLDDRCDAKARCEGSCEVSGEMSRRRCVLQGGVASMEGCPTRHVVWRRVLVRLLEFPVYPGCIPVVPVVEASFNLCPVLPVNGLLEDKTKVHVAGVPLSSVIDCRLVVPFGCDVV